MRLRFLFTGVSSLLLFAMAIAHAQESSSSPLSWRCRHTPGKSCRLNSSPNEIAYAFNSGKVRVVRAHTFAEVNASSRVLAKCGFRGVGEVVDPEDAEHTSQIGASDPS